MKKESSEHRETSLRVQLRPGEALSVRPYGPLKVQTINGCAWITEDRRPQDLVLDRGSEHAWPRANRIIACALDRSDCILNLQLREGDKYLIDHLEQSGASRRLLPPRSGRNHLDRDRTLLAFLNAAFKWTRCTP